MASILPVNLFWSNILPHYNLYEIHKLLIKCHNAGEFTIIYNYILYVFTKYNVDQQNSEYTIYRKLLKYFVVNLSYDKLLMFLDNINFMEWDYSKLWVSQIMNAFIKRNDPKTILYIAQNNCYRAGYIYNLIRKEHHLELLKVMIKSSGFYPSSDMFYTFFFDKNNYMINQYLILLSTNFSFKEKIYLECNSLMSDERASYIFDSIKQYSNFRKNNYLTKESMWYRKQIHKLQKTIGLSGFTKYMISEN